MKFQAHLYIQQPINIKYVRLQRNFTTFILCATYTTFYFILPSKKG